MSIGCATDPADPPDTTTPGGDSIQAAAPEGANDSPEGQLPIVNHLNDTTHADAYSASATIGLSVLGIPVGVVITPTPLATVDGDGADQKTLLNLSASSTASGSTLAQQLLALGALDNTAAAARTQFQAEAHGAVTIANTNLLGVVTADAIGVHADSINENDASAGTTIANLRIGGSPIVLPNPLPANYTLNVNATVGLVVAGLPVGVPIALQVILNEQHGGAPNGTIVDPVVQVIGVHVTGAASVAGLVNLALDVKLAQASAKTQQIPQ